MQERVHPRGAARRLRRGAWWPGVLRRLRAGGRRASRHDHPIQPDRVLDVPELAHAQVLERHVELVVDLLVDGLRDTDA